MCYLCCACIIFYLRLREKNCVSLRQIALSTDIIVGFCGEEEEDHLQTLDLLRSVGYDQAFLFAYSKRDKTYAARHLQVMSIPGAIISDIV